LAWGTIVVILLTIVLSLLSIIFNWIGAPIPMPLLHVANLMFLANIILMCMQKKSKVYSIINKISLALLSPAYVFSLYLSVLRILSMDNMLRAIRKAMLTQDFAYLIICAILMIYLFLPIIIAIINSIFVIKSKL
jgi:hypothetical protein